MANNPYVNKIIYGNTTLIDLTSDTVTANSLLEGTTAHDASGSVINGALVNGDALGYGYILVGSALVGDAVAM